MPLRPPIFRHKVTSCYVDRTFNIPYKINRQQETIVLNIEYCKDLPEAKRTIPIIIIINSKEIRLSNTHIHIISNLCKETDNVIQISSVYFPFFVNIEVMEKRPFDEIKQYILTKDSRLTLDEAEKHVMANFMDLNSVEFDDYKTISLVDESERLKFPCRGINCKHLECFDLTSWINQYYASSDLKCTICSNPIHFNEIVWDPYISTIIEKTPPTCREVIIKPDASWEIPFESIPLTASIFMEINSKEESSRYNEVQLRQKKIEKKRQKINQLLENAKTGNCCGLYALMEKLIIGRLFDYHKEENGEEGYICLICEDAELQTLQNAIGDHIFSTRHLQKIEQMNLSSPTSIPQRETPKFIELDDVPPLPRQPFLHTQSNTSAVRPVTDNFIAL